MIIDNILYQVKSISTLSPLPINEVKNYLRVTDDYDDQLITSLLLTAIDQAEIFTGISLHKRHMRCLIKKSNHRLFLKYSPVVRIIKIVRTINNNKEDINDCCWNLNSHNSYIDLDDSIVNLSLEIDYETGINNEIPVSIFNGILIHISLMYDNPHNNALSNLVKKLYFPYRKLKI